MLHITYYILHITYSIFHITYYILHIAYCILHITYCMLHTTYYILHITYYILRITSYILRVRRLTDYMLLLNEKTLTYLLDHFFSHTCSIVSMTQALKYDVYVYKTYDMCLEKLIIYTNNDMYRRDMLVLG